MCKCLLTLLPLLASLDYIHARPATASDSPACATQTPSALPWVSLQIQDTALSSSGQSIQELDSRALKTDPTIFTLSSDFEITDIPQTREYTWTIDAVNGAPDGYQRQMYTVNGMYPGPLIEANEGDTILIHVTNNLDTGQSLHWHGLLQNTSQWMDGVPGFSQCPIAPNGGTFTYNFTIHGQYGTYWWHSHFGNTLADGLSGGLIVHSINDPLKRGADFDEERIVYLADWVHDQSMTIIQDLLSGGYEGSIGPPSVDAILVNGIGDSNCSSCDTPSPAEVEVPSGKRVRLRLINTGAHQTLRFSVDGHSLEVVEVDDCPVYGPTLRQLTLSPGQRYSVILNTTVGQDGAAFWMRANSAFACNRGVDGQVGLAVMRYVDTDSASTTMPTSQAWDDLAGSDTACIDIDTEYTLTVAMNAPIDVLTTHVMSSAFGTFININGKPFKGFGWNGVTYQNQIDNPLLRQVQLGDTIDSSLVANVAFDGVGGGDLIVNNLDGFGHPYHLHGRGFFLVARGTGTMDAEGLANVQVNTTNPVRRDSIYIPGGSWAALRLITDTPGVWPLHCHIGWHLAQGKMCAIVIQPSAIRQFAQPADWLGLCSGTNQTQVGPGKRNFDAP